MRAKAKCVVVGAALLVLTGCGASVTPDFSYTRTSLGYRNSGLLSEGRIFFWDTGANELIDLGDSVPLNTVSEVGPQTLAASNLSGFDTSVTGDVSPAAQAEINAYISRNVSFEVRDARKEQCANPLDAVLDRYREIQPEKGYYRWRIKELVENPARYKLVVIKDPVYATDETIKVENRAGISGTVSVPTQADGTVKVDLHNLASANCRGENALCFVNVHVAEAQLNNRNGAQTLDLRSTSQVSSAALSEAFRKLI